jgi:hypothetical protein
MSVSCSYRFAPPSHDKPVMPTRRHRSFSRRARRFAFKLFSDFPEMILLAMGVGMMAVALIMSEFAKWPPQLTN